ncbi:hypothetical protein ACQ33O_00475 [Ferruginibacter sp. SUN002]|uniref:hypothetical protein n=1 Tax=Ferruginibacter sp. SUN002 TaxID=2937789 RepID=UPI003D36D37A
MSFKISFNMLLTICLISLLVMINGCNKNSSASFDAVNENKTLRNFDYVGKSHNDGLSSFFQQFTAEQVKAEKSNLNNLNQFLIKSSNTKDQLFNEKLFASDIFNNLRNVGSYEMRQNSTLNQVLSSFFFDKIDKVNDIIANYDGRSIKHFTEQIENMEKEIISSKSVLKIEDGILLSALSTAKYSGQYWTQNFNSLSLGWADNKRKLARSVEIDRNVVNINKVISSDFSGAVGGGVAGALIGGTVATPLGQYPDGWEVQLLEVLVLR